MIWGIAARWIPRAAREDTHRVAACRKLHQQRVIPAETLVDHVLGLRVLVCQHVRGESPFAASDLSDLSSALEKFVETYELGEDEVGADVKVGTVPTPEPPPSAPAIVLVEPVPDLPPVEIESPSRALIVSAPRCFEVVPPPSSRVTLRTIEAAERFVEWVRLANRCATYSSQEFRALYLEHCEAEDLVALADNILRPALLRIDGVTKLRSDSGRKRRERARHFLWRIDHPQATTVAVPWHELPQSTGRRVA